jgi:energy-converting hydrogenase Eha subunit A
MRLALTGLETWVGLVDNVNAAFAADQLVVAMPLHEALEGVAYFHKSPEIGQRRPKKFVSVHSQPLRRCQLHALLTLFVCNYMFSNEITLTLSALSMGVAVVVLMIRLERRKRTNLQPSLIPTTPILLVGGTVAIMALVHLLNLYGIQTGR